MLYAVRLSRKYEELEQFFIRLEDQPILAVFEHPEDDEVNRTHVHFLLQTDLSTDTLKNWIKKALDVKTFPKTDWAFATSYKDHNGNSVDVNLDFITYMSKGILKPKLIRGITDWEQYAAKWVQPKSYNGFKKFKTISERPETARKRQTDMLQPIIDNKALYQTQREIVYAILDVLRKERVITGRYKIRDYYDYVMNQRGNDDWKDDVTRMVTKFSY